MSYNNRNNQNRQGNNKMPEFGGVHAPYNFVPHASQKKVIKPGWRKKTSMDVPLEIGLCGEVEITLKNFSPLMIGGERPEKGPVPFFNVDGTPCIPGSTLRGMTRNIAEIISFSKLPAVNDRYPTLRDLNDKQNYRDRLAPDGQLEVQAGWLNFSADDKRYTLTTCQYARLPFEEIESYFQLRKPFRLTNNFEGKYELLGGLAPEITFDLSGTNRAGEKIARGGDVFEGRVVVSGHVQMPEKRRDKEKKAEYVFYNPGKVLEVSEHVIKAFLAIYDKDVADKSPYAALKKLFKQSNGNAPGIPVFYTSDGAGGIEHLGITLMMKLPPKHSVGQSHPFGNKSEEHTIDITENLFGRVVEKEDSLSDGGEEQQSYSLKSRVSFSDLRMQKGELFDKPVSVVLGQPSPKFYPAYLEQTNGNQEGKLTQRMTSYHNADKPVLRGYKRYPIQNGEVKLQPEMPQLEKSLEELANVRTDILPVLPGAEFTGKIRFHNVTPKELGLLLWILTWGGDKALSHNLGMAKPYGFGRSKIAINQLQVEYNNDPGNWQDVTSQVNDFISQFENGLMMPSTRNGWKDSATMKELLAMAKGTATNNEAMQYMPLKAHAASKPNDGKKNPSNGFALRAFSAWLEDGKLK